MESYDIVMLVVLIGSTVFGAWKGMAWQLASLASLGLSYFMSLRFSEPLAPLFGDQAPWNRFVAMLVLYLSTSLLIWVAFRFVAGMIDRVRLREFDRQLGAIFGAIKGMLFCIAATFFTLSLAPNARQQILDSRSGHCIALLLNRADAILPPEIHQVLDPYLSPIQKQFEPQPGDTHPATVEAPPETGRGVARTTSGS